MSNRRFALLAAASLPVLALATPVVAQSVIFSTGTLPDGTRPTVGPMTGEMTVRGGTTHGATDELGFHAVENRHYVTDLHATVLHQLGLDPKKLEVPGRKRLEIDFGKPIREIMA